MNRGNNAFARVLTRPIVKTCEDSPPPLTNDFFLYALFARIALTNNKNIEFETKYNKATNTIELIIPSEALPIFNQITGMQQGPNFRCFIDWLIGSRNLVGDGGDSRDQGYISSAELDTWFGATKTVVDDKFVLDLPTKEASVFGHNLKTNDDFIGSLKISLIWMFLCGSNTSFDIRATAHISTDTGANPQVVVADNTISTINLISGDIRETEVLDTGNIIDNNNIISLLFHRNFISHTDGQTDSIGVVGIRLQFING